MSTVLDGITEKDYNFILKRSRMCCSIDSPEDLAQDAFLKALENQHKFKGKSSAATWVHGFVGNIAMNQNSVFRGRGGRKGRQALALEYGREQYRLNSFHGSRTQAKGSSNGYKY